MHELGVVFYVIDDVKEVAAENKVSKISSVTLDIGEVTGVVPELLEDCWRWAVKRHPETEGCDLKINTIKAVTHCAGCGADYETVKFGKTCPECGSGETYLIQGSEFLIREIEVEDS